MKKVEYTELSGLAMKQLSKKGAFLTTKSKEKANTMTISWASLGTIWSKPIMTVAVRYSRHSYKMIEQAKEFTVSIPKFGEFKDELVFCGSKSGREYDKFDYCKLTEKKALEIDTPLVDGCEVFFECKVVYQQAMEPALVDQKIKKTFYDSNDDFHVLYYGEIVACYKE